MCVFVGVRTCEYDCAGLHVRVSLSACVPQCACLCVRACVSACVLMSPTRFGPCNCRDLQLRVLRVPADAVCSAGGRETQLAEHRPAPPLSPPRPRPRLPLPVPILIPLRPRPRPSHSLILPLFCASGPPIWRPFYRHVRYVPAGTRRIGLLCLAHRQPWPFVRTTPFLCYRLYGFLNMLRATAQCHWVAYMERNPQ